MHVYVASALPRLMQCGASKVMPGFTPPGIIEQTDDQREGDAAHWLATEFLTGRTTDLYEWIDRKAPNGVYISDDMVDSVEYYIAQLSSRPERRFVEQDFSFQFGELTIHSRPDMVSDSLADYGRRIYIDDFKYGWKIVEPDMNWTLIAYAICFIASRRIDADTVFEFRIHQPRPWHPIGKSRSWIVSAARLHDLRNQMINHLLTVTDTLVTGDHCFKCPARSNCPALRKSTMEVLDVVERAIPDQMTADDLSFMYDALTIGEHRLSDYKSAIKERIEHAIKTGQPVRNYRMKSTNGKLDWVDGLDMVSILRLLAPDKVTAKPPKPITPTQAKKIIPEDMVMQFAERGPGGVQLVRSDTNQQATALAQGIIGE